MTTTEVNGACPLDCPDCCSWTVTVEDGQAVKLRGAKDHPFTRGGLCTKMNPYLDYSERSDRLLHPMRRIGAKGEGRFERTSWDEAIDGWADRWQQIIAEQPSVNATAAERDADMGEGAFYHDNRVWIGPVEPTSDPGHSLRDGGRLPLRPVGHRERWVNRPAVLAPWRRMRRTPRRGVHRRPWSDVGQDVRQVDIGLHQQLGGVHGSDPS